MGVPNDEAAAANPPAPGGKALKTELESLKGFKKRVDKLLDELDGSDAEPGRMGEDRMTAGSLGTGFGEAGGLFRVYHQVHDQLTTLSTLLSGQIGALSTAVDGAHKGYTDTDLEAQRRMWQVQENLKHHYDPKRDPYAHDKGQGDGHGHGHGHGDQQGGGHDQSHDAQSGDGGQGM